MATLDRFPPKWNVAPTDTMRIARMRDGVVELVLAKWGLIPASANDPRVGGRKINAPCQNITKWAEYREPYRAMRRCLVPASGFYEWVGATGKKQAYHVIRADGELMAFAGLWGAWIDAGGQEVLSYAVLTTEPNDIVRPLKDRMPVVLEAADYETWLTAPDAGALLRPAHNEALFAYAVGSQVGNVRNDNPSLIEPIEESDQVHLAQLRD